MRVLTSLMRQTFAWRALGVALVCTAVLAGACNAGNHESRESRQTSAVSTRQQKCASGHVATADWGTTQASRAPVTISLPPGAVPLQSDSAETWRLPSGTFSYSVTERDPAWLDTVSTGGLCVDTVEGHLGRFQYHYGKEAFGEGHYLLAFFRLGVNQELELIGFSPSPGGRDTLFAIARSVRFR